MVVTTRDGDVEDLLSLEHDRLVIQPFRFRQDTLIALFDGVCPLQNVRVGKAWVRMPPDLGFTIAKQAPAAFHVHCEKVEAEMLELPDVLPKSRVLEIVTDLFGQQKRKKNRRRRRASSKRASKRRRNGRAQRRGSQDVIESRLRCAPDARALRLLKLLESLRFVCLLFVLILVAGVFQLVGVVSQRKNNYTQVVNPTDSESYGWNLFMFEMLLGIFFIVELCVRFGCYCYCYRHGPRLFVDLTLVRGGVNVLDSLVTCIDVVRIALELLAHYRPDEIKPELLFYWRSLRVIRLAGAWPLLCWRVMPMAARQRNKIRTRARVAAMRTLDSLTLSVNELTFKSVKVQRIVTRQAVSEERADGFGVLAMQGVQVENLATPPGGAAPTTTATRSARRCARTSRCGSARSRARVGQARAAHARAAARQPRHRLAHAPRRPRAHRPRRAAARAVEPLGAAARPPRLDAAAARPARPARRGRAAARRPRAARVLGGEDVDAWFEESLRSAHAAQLFEILRGTQYGGARERWRALLATMRRDGAGGGEPLRTATSAAARAPRHRHGRRRLPRAHAGRRRARRRRVARREFVAHVSRVVEREGRHDSDPLAPSEPPETAAAARRERADPGSLVEESWVGGAVLQAIQPYLEILFEGCEPPAADGGGGGRGRRAARARCTSDGPCSSR